MQTYLHPERQWVFDPGPNDDPRVFYYKYFDPFQKAMIGPQVYELDPANFRVRKAYRGGEGPLGARAPHLDFRERMEPRFHRTQGAGL